MGCRIKTPLKTLALISPPGIAKAREIQMSVYTDYFFVMKLL